MAISLMGQVDTSNFGSGINSFSSDAGLTSTGGGGGSGGGMDKGGMVSAFSAGQDEFAQAMQFSGMAAGYEVNAGLLDMDAQMILADSDYIVRRMEESGESFVGNQVARYAKAGVNVNSVSSLHVMARSERNIRLDIVMTKHNAVRKANRLGFEALNQRMAAGRARTRMVQSIGSGVLDIASSTAMAGGSA